MELSSSIFSDIIVFLKYSKHIKQLNRREIFGEVVDRNKKMHLDSMRKRFNVRGLDPKKDAEEISQRKRDLEYMQKEIESAFELVYQKKILPSMRSMQFAGKPVAVNPTRIYNCAFLPMDHPDSFSELMFLLLSGCGVGYSVQGHHVTKLPEINRPKKTRRFLVGDSIEGWADSVKVLIKAYMGANGYKKLPVFDFSDIRPKGARLVTSGGKAPGPEPLKNCLHHIQKILDRKEYGEQLEPIEVHDINCYIADAVLAGGIRRSAMISLFSFDDLDMLSSKFGDFEELDPQRHRANNTAVILRHKIKKRAFMGLWAKLQHGGRGEPGFMFSNDQEWGLNPCAEISLRAYQFCNLTTINASDVYDQNELNARAKAAAVIGTLQATYTGFHYLRDIWQETTEKDALIGVSMTGIASGGVLKLNLEKAADIVKRNNARIAKRLGINKAARCTTVKPEGTSSLVLGTSSGIHAWHAPYYIRRMRLGKNEAICKYLSEHSPNLVEDEFYKPHLQSIVSIPQKAPKGAITKDESAATLLRRVQKFYKSWVKPGHRTGHNTNNVSATINLKDDEWDSVGEWMWRNRNSYTALAVFPDDESNYIQPPFETIDKEKYESLLLSLHSLDLTQVIETEDGTEIKEALACAGPGCEIT